ncbi:MAG: membrane or secreted protein [Lutimonas sp.]
MKLLIISIILLGLAFAGIAIKIWAKKDGEFDGTCAGSNAKMKAKGITCGCGNEEGCSNKKLAENAAAH